MRIIHVNTWDTGGAANAAKRLFRAQKRSGMDVSFLSLKRQTSGEDDLNNYEKYLQNKNGILLSKIIIFVNRFFNQFSTKFDSTIFFNRPSSLYRVDRHPLIKEADIIHLHSVVKFIDIPSFFKNTNKPIIWTLHDMNPFSGGMHYHSMMKDSLMGFESKFINIKRKALQNSNIHIVAPSKWLKELSENSQLFSTFPHIVIPYCIDINLFHRINQNDSSKNRKILFVAEDVNDPRKGFKYLLEAISYLDREIQIMVLGNVPRGNFKNYPNIVFLGYVSSSEELAKIYSEADAYVITSIEDNLPNTIIESHICGTPVVGFKTSGILNMIQDGITGTLVDTIDGKAIADGIHKTLKMKEEQKFSSQDIIDWSQEYYSEERVVNEYNKIYKKALSKEIE